jgi:hypothetical protein
VHDAIGNEALSDGVFGRAALAFRGDRSRERLPLARDESTFRRELIFQFYDNARKIDSLRWGSNDPFVFSQIIFFK